MVPARRVLQWQYLDIDRLSDIHLVMQDGHHKLPIVAEHGTLPRTEAVGFGPPQAQHALPRVRVLGAPNFGKSMDWTSTLPGPAYTTPRLFAIFCTSN